MNPLRRLRLQMGLSQCAFATLLAVPAQTYRAWDSGRRRPPRSMLYRATRVKETAGGRLVPLQSLAAEYRVHVRTLRKAAQDGRLEVTFSTRMAYGKLVAFASPAYSRSARTTAMSQRPTGPASSNKVATCRVTRNATA